jgi:hypothetical protein
MAKVPKGLYRTDDGWAMVDYGKHRSTVTRKQYREQNYQPPFTDLPAEKEFKRKERPCDATRS